MPSIEVHVRLRPVSGGSIWSASDSLLFCNQRQDARFAFHRVHPASVTNANLYSTLEPLTHSAFSGQNVTVMAYGQTSSGKTHAMMGSKTDRGLVPRAARTLVDLINAHTHEGASVECGYIEVYNESVYDLLAPKKREMILRDAPDGNVFYVPKDGQRLLQPDAAVGGGEVGAGNSAMKGPRSRSIGREGSAARQDATPNNNNNLQEDAAVLTGIAGATNSNGRLMVPVRSEADFEHAVQLAEKNRSYGETDLNSRSSRSHVILIFEITRRVAGGHLQKSILQFVDLAGSESAARANTAGAALAEGGHINKSLLALGNVVTAIVEKRQVISYRESLLTRILRNCLGGRGLTYLICCVNPTRENYEQTYQSLKFAERAMNIKSDPGITISMAPLIVHQVWKSVQGRMRMMKEREERAYELGIQDTYFQCRDSVGNVIASVDKEVQELLQEHQTLADTVLAHDQQRALRAIQEAQQLVLHSSTNNKDQQNQDAAVTTVPQTTNTTTSSSASQYTLADSYDILQRQVDREETLRNKKMKIEQLRADVDADAKRLEEYEQELIHSQKELEDQSSAVLLKQLQAIDREFNMGTIKIERECWTELNDIVVQFYHAVVPVADRRDPDQLPSAAVQLREVRNFKAQIDKEKQEIEELKGSIQILSQCNSEFENTSKKKDDRNSLDEITGFADAHLASHIESIEATQKMNRVARGLSGSSNRASPVAAFAQLYNNNNNGNGGSQQQQPAPRNVSQQQQSQQQQSAASAFGSNTAARAASPRSNRNNAKSKSKPNSSAPSRTPTPSKAINKSPKPQASNTTSLQRDAAVSDEVANTNNNKNLNNNNTSSSSMMPTMLQSGNNKPVVVAATNAPSSSSARKSAADLIAHYAQMFGVNKDELPAAATASTTTTRSTNNHFFATTTTTTASQSQQQSSNKPKSLPPRSPRPREQYTTNNNNNNNNENFQPIPSNSANRAAMRKQQKEQQTQPQYQSQSARETKQLFGAPRSGSTMMMAAAAATKRSTSRSPPPSQQPQQQSQRSTRLVGNNNSKEPSQPRSAVDTSLFEYGEQNGNSEVFVSNNSSSSQQQQPITSSRTGPTRRPRTGARR